MKWQETKNWAYGRAKQMTTSKCRPKMRICMLLKIYMIAWRAIQGVRYDIPIDDKITSGGSC